MKPIEFKAIVTGTHNWMKVGMKQYVRVATISPFVNTGLSGNKDVYVPNQEQELQIGDVLNVVVSMHKKSEKKV